MFAGTIPRFVCGLAVVCAVAGCESKFVATTVLHPDGSVDREIHQPVAESPGIRPEQGWSKPTLAKDNSPGADNKEYLTTRGHFASPEQIPEHVLFRVSVLADARPPGAAPLAEGK